MANLPNHDGPFVQNSRGPGLLRRLLGGGSNDPTSPHSHPDLSTTQMHEQPLRPTTQASPTAPPSSPFGIPRAGAGTDTFGGGRAGASRPTIISIFAWLFRHPRIAVTLVALLLVFVGQFSDGKTKLEQTSDDLQALQDDFANSDTSIAPPNVEDPVFVAPEPTDPAAAPAAQMGSGSEAGLITLVEGNEVTVAQGTMAFTWKITSPSVGAMLRRNLDQDAIVFWETRNGQTYVTGVSGAGGTLLPSQTT